MTLTNSNRVVTYTGNGATTEWPFSFPATEGTIYVTLFDTEDETLTELEEADFSVVYTEGGGTVTYPLVGDPIASTVEIIIERRVPYTQTLAIGNQSRFYPTEIEGALDTLTKQTQQLAEQFTRTLLVRIGADPIGPINIPTANRSNRALIFNDAGTRLRAGPSADQIASANDDALAAAAARDAAQAARDVVLNALAAGIASAITSSPFAGVAATNVQDALEEIQANLDDVGLTIMANGTFLSTFGFMSATSGFHYFTSSTGGIRPSAWVGKGGICFVYKPFETSGVIVGWAFDSNVMYVRRYTAGAYTDWDTIGLRHDNAVWLAGTSTVPAEVTPAQVAAVAAQGAEAFRLEYIGTVPLSGGSFVATGLGGYSELIVLGLDLEASGAGLRRGLQVSSDGGATWKTGYVDTSRTVQDSVLLSNSNVSTAVHSTCRIVGFNKLGPKFFDQGPENRGHAILNDLDSMNAVRVITVSDSGVGAPSGTIASGSLHLYGRR